MLRSCVLLLLAACPAMGQTPLRFQWPKGQTLEYRVSQTTKVNETVVEGKATKAASSSVHTELTLTKRWIIREVDAAGVATMDLSISQMRQAVTRGDGQTRTIDSANADDAKQMADFLNKPVLTLKVDPRGQIVDVKEARPGAASRIQTELPFRMVLPDAGGTAWARPFTITLDPPHGTGEKYDATQAFTLKGTKDNLAILGLETSLKAPPATAGEKIPLLPMLWSGEVYFDTAAGRYHAARLTVKAELVNHQGEGTKFLYESVYAEDLVSGK